MRTTRSLPSEFLLFCTLWSMASFAGKAALLVELRISFTFSFNRPKSAEVMMIAACFEVLDIRVEQFMHVPEMTNRKMSARQT
jgi:hypothetical protein